MAPESEEETEEHEDEDDVPDVLGAKKAKRTVGSCVAAVLATALGSVHNVFRTQQFEQEIQWTCNLPRRTRGIGSRS